MGKPKHTREIKTAIIDPTPSKSRHILYIYIAVHHKGLHIVFKSARLM